MPESLLWPVTNWRIIFIKSYYVVIKSAFCHIYAIIFTFLAMNSFDVNKR